MSNSKSVTNDSKEVEKEISEQSNVRADKTRSTRYSSKHALTGKLAVELRTIEVMTELYCQDHHNENTCEHCRQFVAYAEQKLDRCVYGQNKPACKHCPIHCYKPEQKHQAQQIMRYSGPKMLFKHPILAIKHLIKSSKKFPEKIPTGLSNHHLRKLNR